MNKCPRCARAANGDPSVGCIDKQTIGCPKALPVVSGNDLVIQCRAEGCDKMFALPVAAIMRRTIPTEISCGRSPCGAVVYTTFRNKPDGKEAGETPRDKRKSRTE